MRDRIVRPLRYAVREITRRPLVAIVAVASLAIGVGANTAVCSLANALLIAPPRGIAAPSDVIDIGRTTDGSGFDTVSYPTFVDVRDRARDVADVYAIEFEPRPMALSGEGGAERIYAHQVSGGFFEILGVRPVAGRFFTASDERVGVPLRALVLSHALWRRRFQSDVSIIGARRSSTARRSRSSLSRRRRFRAPRCSCPTSGCR
jgi:hypothetical protein